MYVENGTEIYTDYMSFKTILDRTYRVNEFVYLMEKGYSSTEEDELGFSKEKYGIKQELHGIIQRPQEMEIDFKGSESNPAYIGYFLPEFDLKTSELNNYRIKYVRPYETLLMKITEYNPNLFLRHNRDHIRLKLILEKKYA